MTTAASGVIARAKELFRDTIATTTAFRTWEGHSWSVAEAKARIYYDALPPPASNKPNHSLAELRSLRPYCLVSKPQDIGLTLTHSANGGNNRFTPYGTLIACFERDVPPGFEHDPGEIDRQLENMIGLLVQSGDTAAPGLVELAGKAGYLNIVQISEAGPFRAALDEVPGYGEYQRHFIQVEWGVRA